jgi:OHCU decarboxylase
VNVIADRVEFTIDFRAPEDEMLRRGDAMVQAIIGGILELRGLRAELEQTEAIPARAMDRRLVEALSENGDVPVTVSGALHDSAVIAPHAPAVMVFVPSKDGISHNPAEFSRVEDIADAARLVERLVRRTPLSSLNQLNREAFAQRCGPFFEHSPWVAERTWAKRPFASVSQLHETMCGVVRAASADEQLALMRAHPDLVGRLARDGRLTRESTGEQAAAGLDALSGDEISAFERYNAEYRERFGFPFIICARENRKDAILAAFPKRLQNTREQEIAAALAEIERIARLRMNDAVWE